MCVEWATKTIGWRRTAVWSIQLLPVLAEPRHGLAQPLRKRHVRSPPKPLLGLRWIQCDAVDVARARRDGDRGAAETRQGCQLLEDIAHGGFHTGSDIRQARGWHGGGEQVGA